ncbi:MAG: hypothetical protein Q9167_005157 [Letrouitia subvulpina]
MRIAVEGCGHGTLNNIYASIQKSCQINRWNGIDLLIIGGDFQAVRDTYDLNGMSVPPKYRFIGDFHEYYSGKRTAPYLTLFVGGNHEASSHLWELYYGGWVAPNIYYMGAANVLRFGPLRIAGLSGIYSGGDYNKPHHERLPYDSRTVKSIYHVRDLDVRKLLSLRTQVDIGISHDWPKEIVWKGKWQQLFRFKPYFETDARSGRLGSLAAQRVMDRLRPRYWFAAHLHCKYAALVQYDNDPKTDVEPEPPPGTIANEGANGVKNTDEIDIELESDQAQSPPATPGNVDVPETLRNELPTSFRRESSDSLPYPVDIVNKITSFLALDKCLPNRKFLQILNVEPINNSPQPPAIPPYRLHYDKEWLAITRAFSSVNPVSHTPQRYGEVQYRRLIEVEEEWVRKHLVEAGQLAVPENFEHTAPVYDPRINIQTREQPKEYTNPQTVAFCKMLEIENFFDAPEEEREERRKSVAERLPKGDGTNRAYHGGGRGGRRGFGSRGRGGRGVGRSGRH